jgi:LCP family protein required for cell wall assembly
MKTTLKRGIGRGASFNGNGRPVLPPTVLAPVNVYRQPPRRSGWGLVGRIVLWFFAAVAIAGAGLAGGAYLFFDRQVAEVRATTPDVVEAQKTLDVVLPGQPEIALVIGYDKRLGVDAEETGFRSDTIMLVRADPVLNAVSLLSFPRDLRVEVKCPGGRSFQGRINSAYGECGAQGSLETVRSLTGLPIHYLIGVNFRGFKQIVARMGGVWLDVDRRYFNDNSSGGERYATIDLQPGYQKVNGQNALDFVRFRHLDSDLYRLARQQMFVKAFKQRLAEFSIKDLPGVVRVITDNVEVGKADKTKVSLKSVLSWGLFAQGLPPGRFFQTKLDPATLQGNAELTTDPANIQAAVEDFANPDVEAPDKATAVALGRRRTSPTGPAPSNVTVAVLNGNGVAGSAANASYELGRIGYRTVTPAGATADAPSYDYFRTKVYYGSRSPDARAAARRVADLFGDADVEPVPPEIAPRANGAMLVAVVGQTFHGTLAPAPRDKTPPKQRPAVRADSTSALGLLRDAQRRVKFPLMNPTVLEQTSNPSASVPIRTYNLEGHGAVRLVFATGVSDYWGIQQTAWQDAPVLSGPNTRQRIGGRTYELHYNGPKLHMVVLRTPAATYWVVNTLLDALSNETMLAIAKGLKPLPR